MISPVVTGIFTVGYLAVTLWLCRGVSLLLGSRQYATETNLTK